MDSLLKRFETEMRRKFAMTVPTSSGANNRTVLRSQSIEFAKDFLRAALLEIKGEMEKQKWHDVVGTAHTEHNAGVDICIAIITKALEE